MSKALDIISKLNVVEFDWKTNDKHDISLIAEQVAKIFPEAIWHKDGKIEGLNVLTLVCLLIKAVQELQKEK